MALNSKTPTKFLLSKRFASSDTPDDILWDDTDLTRDIRSQEIGNCWTYPSINSFESSLIRLGLADRSVHGSEWSLTTLHAANFSRGFSIEPNPNKPSRYAINDKGEFGGWGTYAIQYFSTGTDGAIHLSTPEQTKQIASLFGDVSLGLNERKKNKRPIALAGPETSRFRNNHSSLLQINREVLATIRHWLEQPKKRQKRFFSSTASTG